MIVVHRLDLVRIYGPRWPLYAMDGLHRRRLWPLKYRRDVPSAEAPSLTQLFAARWRPAVARG